MIRRERCRLFLCLALLAVLASPAAAAPLVDPAYTELRGARPDGRRVAVSGFVLARGDFRFSFEEGTFHFLAPVAGRTVGAVFLGRARFRLDPANEVERRYLALASGALPDLPALEEPFEELVLLFGDGTAEEIARAGTLASGPPEPRALAAFEEHLRRQRREYQTNFHLRILRDLLHPDGPGSGVFLAFLPDGAAGGRLPAALAAVDPAGAEATGLGQLLGGEEVLFFVPDLRRGGIWYQATLAAAHSGEPAGGGAAARRPAERREPERLADALAFAIDTRIARDAAVSGSTEIRFKVLVPGLRVLPVRLLSRLRLSAAAFAPAPGPAGETAWRDLPFVQEGEEDDADAAVVFPEALPAGAEVRLRLSYAGDRVLREVGEGTYVVAARQSWYPNLGTYVDPADFQLTFRVPAGRDVVAVGRQVAEKQEGGENLSVWRTDAPVRVAGFNYGRFRRLAREDRESGLAVEVHTNQGTSAAVRALDEAMRRSREGSRPGGPAGGAGSAIEGGDADSELTFTGPELGRVDTSRLAEGAAVDGVNAARIFTTYFGPLPQRHVALTQQEEWTYGQSWPTLVFLPYLAFLTSTQRAQLGLQGAAGFVEEVGFHEISHQWWGHLVGWSSYRDQWLSEGLAEMSAALAVQHTQGWGRYGGFWEARRRQILTRPAGGLAPWEAGPLTLGHRLTTPRTPTGTALLYAKGAFVLHMLRMMLWDGGAKEPDARFVALMKDFAQSFAGREGTAADFQRVAERHMVPALDLAGDGTLGWFFRQWVEGTEIPRFRLDLATVPEAGGLRVRGTVRQEEVGPDFRVILPLYLENGAGRHRAFRPGAADGHHAARGRRPGADRQALRTGARQPPPRGAGAGLTAPRARADSDGPRWLQW